MLCFAQFRPYSSRPLEKTADSPELRYFGSPGAIGELLPGMAYLVRRLLENTSNEGFLRQKNMGEATKEQLLANPIAFGKIAARAYPHVVPGLVDRKSRRPARLRRSDSEARQPEVAVPIDCQSAVAANCHRPAWRRHSEHHVEYRDLVAGDVDREVARLVLTSREMDRVEAGDLVAFRSAGATKRWNETKQETGLPGRPRKGTSRTSPSTTGLPGFIATRQKSM